MKNKKVLIGGFLVIVVIGFGFFWKMQNFNQKKGEVAVQGASKKEGSIEETQTDLSGNAYADLESGKIVYFYSKNCSHCKKVVAFLDENNIYSKVDFIKREYGSRGVWKELSEAALRCGLNPSDVGVPFAYYERKCYVGDADAIDFFAEVAGIKNKK